MDSVFNAAIEEICCEGPDGLHLRDLWPKLSSSLASVRIPFCSKLKQIVLENLVLIPGFKFEATDGSALYNSAENRGKCSVDEYEDRDVKIMASEAMRNGFLGISEIEASESSLSPVQRIILQRVAIARTNGIAQSELAKELRMQPKNIFYPLKTLETLGLIVRLEAVIRKKQASGCGREPNIDSPVHTNMIYLFRYGKHLSSQQRLEIYKGDKVLTQKEVGDAQNETGGDFGEDDENEDVQVKDFLPAMEAICEKLEKAQGKVLVVSEIKIDLGYRGIFGHRSWRKICRRLKDAQLVEECFTVVNKKNVKCLRLLKSFSSLHVEQKFNGRGQDEVDVEQSASLLKRGQITNQIVELPILRQIYDTIDAAGSRGLTNAEVCRGLGLSSKEYHKRYFNRKIFRYGLDSKFETRNRNEVYRLYTAGNFNPEPCGMVLAEKATPLNEPPELNPHDENLPQPMPQKLVGTSISMGNVKTTKESEHTALVIEEASTDTNVDGEGKGILLLQWNPQNSEAETRDGVPDDELMQVNNLITNNSQLETNPTVAMPSRIRSHMRYPYLATSITSSPREQRILKMLKEEKFLIKPDLHRRLESLEKGKNTGMDRKTLERTLNKLQQEGHCKCINVSAPAVTNCSRSRTTVVVLHPSVNVSTEVLGQIHDKMRMLEIQVRQQQSYSRQSNDHSVVTLENVQRVPNSVRLEVHSERAEAMRANGFVLAKMVRAKLLHIFLWGLVSSSPGWDDTLPSSSHACDMKNPHSTWKLFELDLAIKSMPLELFLQIAGSAQKFEDMVEKCRSGLLLSGLPAEEYKCLMDTRATGRLSWLIDMLRRLKLIRLVSKGHTEDRDTRPHSTLTHALEIKPHIEEPVSTVFSSCFLFPDLRPQIRHDFVLSSRTAVDEYWNTLEYCYSAATSRAALLAFPGSAVPEVFRPRSWATARVMTAGQRAELFKRLTIDEPSKKLSFSDCRKIANDLNLTLEQVIRVYYDKRQRYLNRSRRITDAGSEGIQSILPHKRKRYSDRVSSERLTAVDGLSIAAVPSSLLGSDKQFDGEQQSINSEGFDCQLQRSHTSDGIDDTEEPKLSEAEEAHSFLHNGLSRLNPVLRKKYSWTEEADRKLVIEYARRRAALGAKFNRVDWASISNLPAYPGACKRRMALLRTYIPFRKAVSRLCRMLADRYAKYLKVCPEKMLNHVDSGKMCHDYVVEGESMHISDSESGNWDDFDDHDIKETLNNVLRHKRMAKLEAVKDTISGQESKENDFNDCGGTKALSQRSSCRKLLTKYVKLLNKGPTVSRRMHESVAIANAAELFKLIFLSSSTAPGVPTVLAETLRRYSEHDLFSACNYLREKKIMVGGNGKPFGLSHQFLQSICPFTFPPDTGKKAAMFASWLHEREKDLMETAIDVPLDLQCGEIFTLCAKLSSGELLITACLPDEGVGEAEDNRTSKRKFDSSEPESGEIHKKLKNSFFIDGETTSRRGKGFPGIKLSLHRAKISRLLSIGLSKDESLHPSRIFGFEDPSTLLGLNVDDAPSYSDLADHIRGILDSEGSNHLTVSMNESPWEAMTAYAGYVMSSGSYEIETSFLHPDLMKNLYTAIQKSGDQGLGMSEIQKLLNVEDEKMLENVVEVLESFGRVLKVNAYDSIHIVDSLYRSKYFLCSAQHQAVNRPEAQKRKHEDENMPVNLDNHIKTDTVSENETNMISDEMHRVTILNLPEDVADPPEASSKDKVMGNKHSEVAASQMNRGVENVIPSSADTLTCQALFPWINGDGTINDPVYSRLVRRILGIVMQNPGILEDGIINQMRCLNPQSCRKLLQIMIMDNLIIPRKMHQMKATQPPSILASLVGDCSLKPNFICRVHYFANPTCTTSL